ncbi:hypothetical protein [Micrococcus lacusdianchii]|uniref:hypothetical protein n=1 Tax=Micrococcus lacusdianchii TaxID=2915940 RepID=UPI002004C518|nr:hypothetical protein [Micrococcus sp. JXJ CY 30]
MSISSFLTGRATALLPLPARLAVKFGPRAVRAYGDWRGMNARPTAAAKRGSGLLSGLIGDRRGPSLLLSARRPARRAGFPWGVGLGGFALGAASGAVAGRLLPAGGGKEDRGAGSEPTLVTREDTTTAAPVTRTTIEQPRA